MEGRRRQEGSRPEAGCDGPRGGGEGPRRCASPCSPAPGRLYLEESRWLFTSGSPSAISTFTFQSGSAGGWARQLQTLPPRGMWVPLPRRLGEKGPRFLYPHPPGDPVSKSPESHFLPPAPPLPSPPHKSPGTCICPEQLLFCLESALRKPFTINTVYTRISGVLGALNTSSYPRKLLITFSPRDPSRGPASASPLRRVRACIFLRFFSWQTRTRVFVKKKRKENLL